MTDTALIGGSGFEELAGFQAERRAVVATPWGAPSDALVFGRLGARRWVFLSRHGAHHAIPPHLVNYRANLWALRQAGVKRIVALAAVGGISAALRPGSVLIPHQIIDYTWGRAHTFFDHPTSEGVAGGLQHVEFSDPYSEAVRGEIIAAAKKAGVSVTVQGVYAATQGPRLETAVEINRLERDGADVVGMTAMPEAALARELGIEYAAIAMVVNPAAGRGDAVSLEMIAGYLESAAEKVLQIIARL